METTLNERIEKVFKLSKLTQEQFEQKTGVKRQSLSKYIHPVNSIQPGLSTLKKIIKAFPHISENWLMFGDGNMLVTDNMKVEEPQFNYDSKNQLLIEKIKMLEELLNKERENALLYKLQFMQLKLTLTEEKTTEYFQIRHQIEEIQKQLYFKSQ